MRGACSEGGWFSPRGRGSGAKFGGRKKGLKERSRHSRHPRRHASISDS